MTPLFEAARRLPQPCFVYFIGEPEGGPIKIGSANDPVVRLRGLQTGNPRRLAIEYVLVGDANAERLLHEFWESFAIRSQRGQKVDAPPGTEWFSGEIRAEIEPILKTAAEWQVHGIKAISNDELELDLDYDWEGIIREAHGAHDFVAKQRHQVRLLAPGAGYIVPRRSRI